VLLALPPADHLLIERERGQFVPSRRRRMMANVRAERLLKIRTDDLRLYGWVQFFPCIALPLLFVAFPAKYSGTSCWVIAAAFYALAKLFEFYEHAIDSVGFILSGHTLKHFAAASACFAILRYFQIRRPVS
jgi:hypothetical protein